MSDVASQIKRVSLLQLGFKEICWWFSTQDLTHILRQITPKPRRITWTGSCLVFIDLKNEIRFLNYNIAEIRVC